MSYQKPGSSPSKQWNTPQNTSKAVSYAKHFPRSFLSPYGQALGTMSDDKILNRVQFFTCEWLNRPAVAMSEFSETMTKNLNPIEQNMMRFDSKNTECFEAPTLKDLAEIMKFLEGSDELDAFMNKVFEASGALFLMSINYLVPSTLFWNPEEMAKRTSDSVTAKGFKENPSREMLKKYLMSAIFPRATGKNRGSERSPTGARESIWEQFDDNDGDQTHEERPSMSNTPATLRTTSRRGNPSCHKPKSPLLNALGFLIPEEESDEFDEGPLTPSQTQRPHG
ncbi:hypothetical protein OS493_038298 [Desmophyllum pertusum]|uniref:Uncharacterized protein n=1 Tax=Desmophyllum pertusum TaxID=174260 RepID=A0A9W9Z7L0_9CNID|nr:hypothetical protein OS493_038298 [Desmophyllum pertusum]